MFDKRQSNFLNEPVLRTYMCASRLPPGLTKSQRNRVGQNIDGECGGDRFGFVLLALGSARLTAAARWTRCARVFERLISSYKTYK